MLAIIENKSGIKYIQILPVQTEGATKNIGEFSSLRNLLNVKHHAP